MDWAGRLPHELDWGSGSAEGRQSGSWTPWEGARWRADRKGQRQTEPPPQCRVAVKAGSPFTQWSHSLCARPSAKTLGRQDLQIPPGGWSQPGFRLLWAPSGGDSRHGSHCVDAAEGYSAWSL